MATPSLSRLPSKAGVGTGSWIFAPVARRCLPLLSLLVGLALGGFGAPVLAAATITPVIIDVPSNGRAIVTVRNDRDREVLYQAWVMDWHVVNGVDRYEATQDFIASPPLFTLAPSASQIVRIGLRSPTRQPVEQAYRLVLAEVSRPGAASAEGGVVDFAMQYLLPVFVAPSDRRAKPALTWSVRAEGTTTVVRVDNAGAIRMALNLVGLSSQVGTKPAPEWVSRQRVTVLAHSWREWRIAVPGDKASQPWRILVIPSGSDALMIVPDVDIRPVPAH